MSARHERDASGRPVRFPADEMTRVCDGATCTPSTAGVYYGYEKDGALSYFGPNADESDLSDVQATAGLENSFLLHDYEGRYLRTGHCYDQWTGTPPVPDGAISMGDIQRVVAVFGSWEGQALYDPWADTNAASGPDGAIGIGDISRVVGQFGQACPDTGHYVYNGDGLRVEKWAGSNPITKSNYVWDVGSALPAVLQEDVTEDPDGSPSTTRYYYVYGLDLLTRVKADDTDQTFFQCDGLGSTTGLTDGAGTPVKTYAYDAFGAVRSTGIDQADTDFRFTGEQEDGDVSGLYYLRARYYDPALGRFWTQDPWGGSAASPQTLNKYPYAGSNPANTTDPSGRQASGSCPAPSPVRVPAPPPTPVRTPTPSPDPDKEGLAIDVEAKAKSLKDCMWDCFCDFPGPDWWRGISCGATWGFCGGVCASCVASLPASAPTPVCLFGCSTCLGLGAGGIACLTDCRRQ